MLNKEVAIRQNINHYTNNDIKFITYKLLKPYATKENLEDLKQAAALGISKAIKSFKEGKGSSFKSWAYLKVRKELQLCKNQEYQLTCSPQTRQGLPPEIHICEVFEQEDKSNTKNEPEVPELLLDFFGVNIGLSRYINISIDKLVYDMPIPKIAKKHRKTEKRVTDILNMVKEAFKQWYNSNGQRFP